MTKGLQCIIIGGFQTQSAILEVFRCERINTAKQKDGLSFLMFSVLEAKIFDYGFLEEQKMCVNNRY